MSYFALYRKYRPQYFCEVIGQDHIVTTLKHQVQHQRIAHAYLFSGTRGTGKTTVAKIFARAINCLNPNDGEPCGVCSACLSAQKENPDIIEIDAASNNGINEMRDLREKVRFAPLESNYKIYILDEAHMITHDAFNALLKTLEEPPAHVVFILATTEPQRLPATILSRCQRFEFHRIHTDEIVQHLQTILAENKITMDNDGLHAIARAAQGGLRDALSIADQCIDLSDAAEGTIHITYAQVLDILGSMDQDFLFQVADALIGENCAVALQSLDIVLQKGRDIGVFCNDLLQHFRTLMLICSSGKSAKSLVDCSEALLVRFQEQTKQTSLSYLLRTVRELSKLESDMKWMTDPRILLESCLITLCFPDEESTLPSLLEKISRLEKKVIAIESPKNTVSTAIPISGDSPTFSDEDIPPPVSYEDYVPLSEAVIQEAIVPTIANTAAPSAKPISKPTIKTEEVTPPFIEITTSSDDPDQAQEIFQALLKKQSEAIRKIFTLYQWTVQWMDEKTLLLIAPANCLPTLVKSLAAQTDMLLASISDQYPNIQLVIADGSTKFKKQSAVVTVEPTQSPNASLLEQATNFFGQVDIKNDHE